MTRNNYIEGVKFGLGFLTIIFIIGIVGAVGFHTANEITSGTFSGNFSFVDGNVGIGITTPSSELHLIGDEIIEENGDGDANLQLMSRGTGMELFEFRVTDASVSPASKFSIRNSISSIWYDRLTISGDGNIGIGTTNPNSILQIGTGGNGIFEYIQIDSGTTAPLSTDCDLSNETARMYLDTDSHILYICNSAAGRGWDKVPVSD